MQSSQLTDEYLRIQPEIGDRAPNQKHVLCCVLLKYGNIMMPQGLLPSRPPTMRGLFISTSLALFTLTSAMPIPTASDLYNTHTWNALPSCTPLECKQLYRCSRAKPYKQHGIFTANEIQSVRLLYAKLMTQARIPPVHRGNRKHCLSAVRLWELNCARHTHSYSPSEHHRLL